ncbi:hypothetical protein TPHA_0G00160 [Tetrapisispora phaffii CBS 4417]|uniref:NADH-cytochrome b5 reductase n=1 Tax=Tetrapisispora phaffii (strain ATCC 24235 / CBS 4417 / NBRC 1672 / NRRL Y-8282 / UCD 70-5) TaxID=1071381 RepID=G8BVC9_TETPH|nr:hypothetical protein TPHA_0G00160 [Tetrapisispora phaffii CBS 4417]CCE63857.1 hypothetical protein TPHA_0G00160 [Tetrapisispora phaffii CBS 4417]
MLTASIRRTSAKTVLGGLAAIAAASYLTKHLSTLRNDSPKTFQNFRGPFFGWIDLPISKIEDLSSDARRFTFKLPLETQISGVEPISFLLTKPTGTWGPWNIRPYTPISSQHKEGEIEFVVKKIDGGKMSSHLFSLKVNDTVSFNGPISRKAWKANEYDSVTLLGAGSGITPLYQLINSILLNPEDKTKITLLYGNKTAEDILLHRELEELKSKHPERLAIKYYLSNSSKSTEFAKSGYISKDDLKEQIPSPDEKTFVFVCGPDEFVKAYAGAQGRLLSQGKFGGILSTLGYNEQQVFKI